MFFGHNSEPSRNFGTILRHKLPIIHPDLSIPTRSPNSSVQPEFSNPKFLYKTEKTSRVLTAERIMFNRNNYEIKNAQPLCRSCSPILAHAPADNTLRTMPSTTVFDKNSCPLEGNRADSRKFLVEYPIQKSGS